MHLTKIVEKISAYATNALENGINTLTYKQTHTQTDIKKTHSHTLIIVLSHFDTLH